MKKLFSKLRKEYTQGEFLESTAAKDPIIQFNKWFKEAILAGNLEANAMSLATTGRDGKPACRIVLLKDMDAGDFIFFTNYNSRKGEQIEANHSAAILFYWPEVQRQVRIEGVLKKTSATESDRYFASRPYESRLSAVVSSQSMVISDRAVIDRLYNEMRKAGDSIKRPKYWGGYRLIPSYFEFWQGRANRLHDRIVYEKNKNIWNIKRLAP